MENGDIEVRLGDITREGVEAIVTVVNEPLINEAIHRAAGPRLAAAFTEVGPGQAVSTPAFDLSPVKHVIHTVAPVGQDEDLVLTDCYLACLLEAEELEVESVAFPVIGTNVVPAGRAAEIAAITLRSLPIIALIRLVASDQAMYETLVEELDKPIVERCPTCGADAVPFLVGLSGSFLQAAADVGLVRLGGCFSQGEGMDPQWECTQDSSHRWTNGQKDDRRQQAAVQEVIAVIERARAEELRR